MIALALLQVPLFAQQSDSGVQKFALVIGNGAYTGLAPLANPVNDANDVAAVLEHLGFTVEKVLNGTMFQMEDAALRLKDRLNAAGDAHGFFFYAGHGVQAGGENYLIPVDANIPNENYLRNRAVSVQTILDDLNDAGSGLNVVVLDACRDNPFGWNRSGTRGLAIVSRQPSDSIIVYSTSAGQRASDGDGRNGLFTSQLINNLATPGLEVSEVFKRTGADVARVSSNQQIPAVYSQFFGTAYLGQAPDNISGGSAQSTTTVIISRGNDKESEPSKFWSVGAAVGSAFSEPVLAGTIKGTLAPFKYQFFEVGLNAGLISTRGHVDSFFSVAPYLHYAFFWPFNQTVAIYAGLGAGYKIAQYSYFDTAITVSSIPADAAIGVLLFNFLDVSFTLSYPLWSGSSSDTSVGKTLLKNVSGQPEVRFLAGYSYWFK